MQPGRSSTSFEKWLKEKFRGNSLLFVGKINKEYFERTYLEALMKYFTTSRVIKIENIQEWEKKSKDLLQTPLFENNKTIVFCSEVEENAFLKIKKSLAKKPNIILIGTLKSKPKKLSDVPQITLQNFSSAHTLPALIRQSLLKMQPATAKKLVRYWHEASLREEDVIQFLSHFSSLQEIKPEDVETYFENEEKNILFRFLDAVIEGETEKALKYLDLLLKKGFPYSLLISNLARKLRLILQCLEKQQPQVDLWTGRKINSYELRKIGQQSSSFSPQKIKNAFRILRESDRILKTSSVPPQDILFNIVVELTSL
ncbi:MAG: hypothetical protein J7J32_05185 [Candidatus Atribacteria bacterium]|nr:hypothetical protein [Candidatus Atribacteria bacterium]MCD6350072.1 hypothetical protein [Candidatus Atribacteria bacterium]